MSWLYLTPRLLAKRWNLTTATLRQWRWFRKGPQHLKIGGRILYRIVDIEKFEENILQYHTTMRTENIRTNAPCSELPENPFKKM